MAESKQTDKKIVHNNIFEALSAFQGEALEIKKTKHFGTSEDKMHFMYASLDDVLDVVRPFTSKHGLSFMWEGSEEGIVCVLYHETYVKEQLIGTSKEVKKVEADSTEIVQEPVMIEKNVLRSMYVKVSREGDMKTIGNNSTYARRYTLCEVLGVASDEDKDVGRLEQLEGFAMKKAKEDITKATTVKKVETLMTFLEKDLSLVKKKRKTGLGLNEKQYNTLIKLGREKIVALGGKDVAGENSDQNGQAQVEIPKDEDHIALATEDNKQPPD